jgi:uncharacterized protein
MHRVTDRVVASGFRLRTPIFAVSALGRRTAALAGPVTRTVAALLLALATTAALSAQEPPPSQVPSIVTNGEAIIRRAPDQATIYAAVETRARSPRDAQRQNADLMAAVQKRIADAGIAKDAVRTTGYSVQQEFDYTNGRRIPREYVARNGVEVRLDAIDRTGEILDAVVQAGATNIGGVQFDLKDRAAAEREALRLAVVDARGRADALAAGAGRAVDRILRIDDTRQQMPMPVRTEMMTARAVDAAAPTPIAPATIEIRAHVVLTVAIK